VATLALTGCMRLEMQASVDAETDTVSGSFITAVEKKVLTMENRTLEQGWDITQKHLAEVPKGDRVEVFDDGTYYGRRIVYDRQPLSKFTYVRHVGDRYVFELDGAGPLQRLDQGAKGLLKELNISISFTFPGKVLEHDPKGVVRGGNTVSWKMALSEFTSIRAVSQEKPGFPWALLLLVAGLFAALIAVGLAVLLVRTRRRQTMQLAVD
jgi:hypothetical protein